MGNSGGGGLSEKGFRNLNRRGLWPLVSVEKDSHAQPPLAAMTVFPSPGPPPGKRLAFGLRLFCGGGSACGWTRFPARWLWSRRLTEPPWTQPSRREPPPPFRRNPLRRIVPPQTPATLRERGSGGEGLLLEKRPLPQRPPSPTSLEKGARGRGLFFRKGLSLAITPSI